MITKYTPDTWQSLQSNVGRILSECDFKVEVEKTVRTARGEVELDVYAEEIVKGRKYSIACECKHWKNRVPKTVIHSFRTVVAEIGANIGYIVSTKGFQSGSFSAAELTNLKLVTWPEFQTAFEESWYESYLTVQVDEKLDPLFEYAAPFVADWFPALPKPDKKAYMNLKSKYDLFGMIMQSFGPYRKLLRKEPVPTLPLIQRLTPDKILDTIPREILEETAYREFLEAALRHGQNGIDKFEAIRNRNKS